MRQIFLLAGAAALAASSAALAQGKGNGGGNDKGGPPAAAQGKPDGGGKRGNPGGGDARKADRGPDRPMQAQGRPAERGPDRARPDVSADRGRPDKGNAPDRIREVKERGNRDLPGPRRKDVAKRSPNIGPSAERFSTRRWSGDRYRYDDRNYVLSVADGCPPGLAKKGNGCLPPGQARKLGPVDGWSSWYPSRYRDDDWWYGDGYLYRAAPSGGLVSAFIPLLGGALFGGNLWPAQYTDYEVPAYYDRFYGYDDGYDYRYADDAIFAVDPQTQAIQAIAGLLTGDGWSVGQPMPNGYDLYNVPLDYRDRYADGPDAWYRYSDGYVYEVDPTTQLVRTVIELLG